MIRTKIQAWSVSHWLRGSSLVEHFWVTAEGGRLRLIPHDALKMTRLATSTQTQCLPERINLDREDDDETDRDNWRFFNFLLLIQVCFLVLSSIVSEADIWITYDQMLNTVELTLSKHHLRLSLLFISCLAHLLLCWLSRLQLWSDFFFSWENWSGRRYFLFSDRTVFLQRLNANNLFRRSICLIEMNYWLFFFKSWEKDVSLQRGMCIYNSSNII